MGKRLRYFLYAVLIVSILLSLALWYSKAESKIDEIIIDDFDLLFGDGDEEAARATIIDSPQTNKLTNGLVGYWSFNGQDMDWSSTTAEALDRSGQGNNGEIYNFGNEGVRSGVSGQSLSFDGDGDYVIIDGQPDLSSNMTLSAWIKLAGPANNGRIMDKGPITTGYFLGMDVLGDNSVGVGFGNNNWYSTIDELNYSQWYHVVAIWTGSNPPVIYIDGVIKATTVRSTWFSSTLDNLHIGNRILSGAVDRSFNGLIDEVRIYNRALSVDEIRELYQAGARKFYIDPNSSYKTYIQN